MTPGRGGGQGSPRGKGNSGAKRMGFLEAQIRRANGEHVPVYNNMTADVNSWESEGRRNSDNTSSGSGGNQSGLNPNRIRGFGSQGQGANNKRVETPSLNEMRAKQGAIVAKFMTFFKRRSTLVVEMYESCFYKEKPKWDQIADFVYKDLCPTDDLRKAVKDVQLHPVKMLIFIRFSDDRYRDLIVSRIRSSQGVMWSDYRVKVKGYSLDAKVKFIRLLGVSPETESDEIVKVIKEVGIGDVIEIKKGYLDSVRLPGVTNGTWSLRVKIADEDRSIPSYIHRRDEGELWSLNFEGRVFCCWKCGSPTHIGDKCRDQSRTFEEIFDDNTDGFIKPTWAAVVRSGNRETDAHIQRVREMEARVLSENRIKDKELKEIEERNRRQDEAIAAKKAEAEARRQKALRDAEIAASEVVNSVQAEKDGWGNDVSDAELLEADISISEAKVVSASPSSDDSSQKSAIDAIKVASLPLEMSEKGRGDPGLNAISPPTFGPMTIMSKLPPELDLIMGSGSRRLALEYHHDRGNMDSGDPEAMDTKSEGECNLTKTDYLGNGLKGRKRLKGSKIVDHRGIERENRSRGALQRHESESSSSSDGNNKKLRLEEEEALWNEAVLSIPLKDN